MTVADAQTETQRLGAALDALAAKVFGGDCGAVRIEPLLAQWATAVGPLREEDPDSATWQAVRTDWALCDASSNARGDSWALRACRGELADVEPAEVDAALARSIAGLWRVQPGRRPWLSCMLSGIGVELSTALRLLPAGEAGPNLWEARVIIDDGVAVLCRAPLAYPAQIESEVRRRGLARLSQPETTRHDVLHSLRRQWLQWARAPRADARLLFAPR